jgi:hypothetical protein
MRASSTRDDDQTSPVRDIRRSMFRWLNRDSAAGPVVVLPATDLLDDLCVRGQNSDSPRWYLLSTFLMSINVNAFMFNSSAADPTVWLPRRKAFDTPAAPRDPCGACPAGDHKPTVVVPDNTPFITTPPSPRWMMDHRRSHHASSSCRPATERRSPHGTESRVEHDRIAWKHARYYWRPLVNGRKETVDAEDRRAP